jgi:alkanesulfonate monooxygenase SsuD/methylene tetrahydromethanopterin reductase-like flavin-dependent oxidoreductase (luciferase family)
MECGIFHTPYMRPERSDKETFKYSLDLARQADQVGFRDFMVGEHATQAWENIPNPELVIAAAAMETDRLRFAPMAHILPLHLPGDLAIQVGYLSRILEGRYFLGIGAGSWENDAILRGQPGDLSEAQPRMRESLEIMQRIWRREAFEFRGQYFAGGYPDVAADHSDAAETAEGAEFHALADHSPWGGADNLEIAVTGLSPRSPSLKFAGERGFKPISFFGGTQVLKTQWDTYATAARSAGYTPNPADFRVSRDIFVADTDKEAKKLAINGALGYAWEKYLVPIYKKYGIFQGYIDDSGTGIDVQDVDMEFLAEHVWLCGSPETIIEKINRQVEMGVPFGQLDMNTHDAIDDPAPWLESMRLLATEVVPNIQVPTVEAALV